MMSWSWIESDGVCGPVNEIWSAAAPESVVVVTGTSFSCVAECGATWAGEGASCEEEGRGVEGAGALSAPARQWL